MPDEPIGYKTLHQELNAVRVELNEKLDAICDKMDNVADARVTHNELNLTIAPLIANLNLHNKILWLIGSTVAVAIIGAVLGLVITT